MISTLIKFTHCVCKIYHETVRGFLSPPIMDSDPNMCLLLLLTLLLSELKTMASNNCLSDYLSTFKIILFHPKHLWGTVEQVLRKMFSLSTLPREPVKTIHSKQAAEGHFKKGRGNTNQFLKH